MAAAAAAPRSRPDPAHPSGAPPCAPVFPAFRLAFRLSARCPPAAPFSLSASFLVFLCGLPRSVSDDQKKY
jgi:hypothetical protein